MARHVESIGQEAAALQVEYAHAVDTRDWTTFASLFTDDVHVEYAQMPVFEGMRQWLDYFVPFHDACRWTLHSMSNHRAAASGETGRATCVGDIRWVHADQPGVLNQVRGLYQDFLRYNGTRWLICDRRMSILSVESVDVSQTGVEFPTSVFEVARRGTGDADWR